MGMAVYSKFLKRIKYIFPITVGTAILSFATASVLIPFELVTGGISGIAIVVGSLFGDGVLPAEITIALLTWTAFFTGLFFLGKSFALKTLLSSVLYPLFVSLFIERGISDIFISFFDFKTGTLFASVIGGALVGFGCALSFLGGGSTGGVDILALILCKKNERLKIHSVMLFIDAAIILLGALVIRNTAKTLLGIFSALTSAFTIQAVMNTKFRFLKINWHDKKIDNFKK